MTRLYGLTFEGCDETKDGTGIVPDKAVAFIKPLPKAPTIRIVMFPGIDPYEYFKIIEPLKKAGARIMLQPVDSSFMADYSIAHYGKRFSDCLSVLRSLLGQNDIVECGNEINGQSDDKNWPGPHAYEKTMQALAVAKAFPLKTAVTFFLDDSEPNYMFQWLDKHNKENVPMKADFALISYYPDHVPKELMATLEPCIVQLARRFPGAGIGIGEYGVENFAHPTATDLLAYVHAMEFRDFIHPQDIGGGFFWDAYADMVAKATPMLLAEFMSAWRN